jgi:hypothetical protein
MKPILLTSSARETVVPRKSDPPVAARLSAPNLLITSITGQPMTLDNLKTAGAGLSKDLITSMPGLDTSHDNGLELTFLDYDATRMFRALRNTTFPQSIALGVNYQHYTGYPLDPTTVCRRRLRKPESEPGLRHRRGAG